MISDPQVLDFIRKTEDSYPADSNLATAEDNRRWTENTAKDFLAKMSPEERAKFDALEPKVREAFTTGSSPVIASALLASPDLIRAGDDRRAQLKALATQLADGLAPTRWQLLPSPTAIQPILIGDNHEALRVANALYERGLWVPAIRPPTVPKGTARLRVSLSAAHSKEQVALLVDALRELA